MISLDALRRYAVAREDTAFVRADMVLVHVSTGFAQSLRQNALAQAQVAWSQALRRERRW